MLEKIENPGKKLKFNDIKNLEKQFNVILPEDYIEFLLQYNGGLPTPNAYYVEGHPEEILGIQVFFGIGREIESSCLDWNYKESRYSIPSELFPIGCSDTDDWICFSLQGESKGSVFFWDAMAESEKPSYSNVYKIADSFSDFLNGLFED